MPSAHKISVRKKPFFVLQSINEKNWPRHMIQKLSDPKILFLICCGVLGISISAEPSSSQRAYMITETIRGVICIGLSIVCWYAAQFFGKRSSMLYKVVEWCLGMLAIFVFFPFSAFFFQNVSSLVALLIMGYLIFLVFISAGGGSWDGRDPADGGE